MGDDFSCRSVKPSDTSVDVLIVIDKNLPIQRIKEALLAGFPPSRIVTVTEELQELQEVCLRDLGIPFVVTDPRNSPGADLLAHIRSGLSHFAAPPLARSRIEETLGQLDMQQSETFQGVAFKQQLTNLDLNAPEDSGLCVSVIPSKRQEYPVFAGLSDSGEDVAIMFAVEEGLNGLNAREHALFTQALISRCLSDNETGASLVDRFIEEARSMLGREELFRPTLLVFQRSLQTLEVLLTGDLDLWIINSKRLPPLGITRGPGVALSGAEDSPHGKIRRIKLTSGDHLLVLPSGWFMDNEVNPKARKMTLLEAANAEELPDFLKLTSPHDSGTAIVVAVHDSEDRGTLE